jgi:hypothetical protein
MLIGPGRARSAPPDPNVATKAASPRADNGFGIHDSFHCESTVFLLLRFKLQKCLAFGSGSVRDRASWALLCPRHFRRRLIFACLRQNRALWAPGRRSPQAPAEGHPLFPRHPDHPGRRSAALWMPAPTLPPGTLPQAWKTAVLFPTALRPKRRRTALYWDKTQETLRNRTQPLRDFSADFSTNSSRSYARPSPSHSERL